DEQGKSYIIEMQVLNVEGFEQRVLYNACKAYSGQLTSGQSYHTLTDVIAITITDFLMFKELSEVVNRFKLRAASGHVYHDDLELVFAELPKFNKSEDELSSVLDRWFYFLKCAGSLEVVPKCMEGDSAINHAFAIANKAGLSREELDDQEHREIFIQDQRGGLSLAKKQGREEGREEGEINTKISIAQSLLPLLNDAEIASSTGLSFEEVRKLRCGLA
ncbi:MAG: Rpn family recombination-promoting nuclease/putative transposase, partial [Mariprofundaceae bacterium]|nr:Rpn family recombination-promoting nuclease/putative transposase [Mariprofundaceae bacterium]